MSDLGCVNCSWSQVGKTVYKYCDVCSPWAKALADKEREWQDKLKREIKYVIDTWSSLLKQEQTKLAAANAVIEAGDAFRNCPNSEEVVKRMTEFFKVLAEHKLKRQGKVSE